MLLLALAVHRRTAVLELRRTPLQKEIVFDDGVPVDCRSNVATESLGRFLVSSGKLSEEQARSTLSLAVMRGVPHEEILSEHGVLPASELYRHLQQNLARKLLDPFTWRQGSYRISYDVPFVTSPLKVRVPQLVLTGIAKLATQEEVEAAVAPFAASEIVIDPYPLLPLDELKLTADQAKIVEELRTARRIDDLRSIATLPVEEVHRTIYALALLGAITTPERLQTLVPERAAPVAEPPLALEPEPLPPPPREPRPRDRREAEKNREALMQAFLSYRRKDAFELFDLADDVPLPAVIWTYIAFAERFAPWKFDDREDEGIRDKAQEVFLAGARAYAQLADPERRKGLVERRRLERELPKRRSTADRVPLKSDLLDPEMQYRKGLELFAAGKPREALSYFEFAVDCDSLNGVYAAELAFCRFFLLISPAQKALDALKQVMRVDPNCGLAYFYAGKVHATLGNRVEAEGYLARAAKMMIRDRRAAEALKELRGRA
jgi:tetratricopeptide (TPR) repeat protein